MRNTVTHQLHQQGDCSQVYDLQIILSSANLPALILIQHFRSPIESNPMEDPYVISLNKSLLRICFKKTSQS